MSRLALSRLTSQSLTSHQALQLAADFAFTADYMRTAESDDFQDHDMQNHVQTMAKLYETASRAVFLRAHVIAKAEEVRPVVGESFRRAAFAVA